MKLLLKGHDYKYAAEQMLLTLFPGEKPEYTDAESDSSAEISLTEGAEYATAVTKLFREGKWASGTAKVRLSRLTGKLRRDSLLSMAVKLSFYRAAMKLLPEKPAWGALTGIRPGTIMTKLLESGLSEKAAVSEMKRLYFLDGKRASLLLDTSRASIKVKEELEKGDIGIYVGIPFCPTRCAYCSFVSQSVQKSMKLIPPFLDALERELRELGGVVRELGLRPVTVYIGGGTPTTLSPEELTRLIAALREAFDFSHVRDFSVEAGRPDTITAEKLDALRNGGVTRISVNPQSTSDEVLRAIGRSHTAEDFRNAYRLARERFGGEINTDLIAGLPADTPESFAASLREMIALGAENITVHTLSLKKGTAITLGNVKIPGKAEVAQMLETAIEELRGAGYSPYYLYRQKNMSGGFENVGWSKKGRENLYNIVIMEELCTIIAAGGGASTKLVDTASGRIERIFDYKYPKEYIEGIEKTLADKDKIRKFYREAENEIQDR